jgi:uncharacterized protein (DUF433 family)
MWEDQIFRPHFPLKRTFQPEAYTEPMKAEAENIMIDWSGCPLVEINPRKVSGAPLLRGTRVQADSIVQNFEGGESIEDIVENFDISAADVRSLLAFAADQIAAKQ